jgi:ABC-2 type transport system permease protein
VRDTTRPLPFVAAARGVFDLSLESMVWSRRTVFMAVLLGLPILFALLFRFLSTRATGPETTAFDLYGLLVAFYYVGNVLPLTALFYGSALIAEEVDGRTITYLLTRPIGRPAILTGKFAAYLATTLSLTLPAAMVTFFLLATAKGFGGLGSRVPDLFRDLGVLALTLAVYGALFTLLGVLVRRPVIPGLLFIFVWELVSKLPGDMPRYTITTYLRSLVKHRPADEGLAELFGQVLPTALCLEVLGAMIVVFLAGSLWIFNRREYVLEQ